MILVVDVGTSSLRGILFDRGGRPLWKEQREYDLYVPGNGVVEMDLEILDYHLEGILKMAGVWLEGQEEKLDGISVTAQRSSVIPVDREGKPLRRAMMWQDTRAAENCSRVKDKLEQIYGICGMRPSPVFSAPKMQYIKENWEEIYREAYKLIGFQEYVICRLTGEFATDYSIASRTCLFNISSLQWSKELAGIFDIDEDKLCRLIQVGSSAGDTKQEVNSLLGLKEPVPVISAGGDQQCAALGMGCLEDGQIVANSGTGSYVIAVSDQPLYDGQMRVNCNVSAVPGKWIVEGAVLSAGKGIDWLNRLMFAQESESHPFENFTKACQSAPAGSKGLVFLPLMAGKGTPSWNPNARGVICNLGFEHEKGEFARALLEGTASEMKGCIQVISELTGEPYREVRVSGGMTKNPVYDQIQADLFLRTVIQAEGSEATGLGAWISGAVTLGYYHTYKEAYLAASGGQGEKRYEPDPDTAAVYETMYKKLRDCESALYEE